MIKPFIHLNKYLENIGFDLTRIELDLTADNWLRVHVRWNCENEEGYKTKHPIYNGWQFSLAYNSVDLAFPEFGYDEKYETLWAAKLDVGIENTNGEKINWRFKFHENLGYGVNVYFAPKTWNTGKDIPICYWDGETGKEIIHKEID